MNIETLRTYDVRLEDLSVLANKVSKEYHIARVKHSDCYTKVQFAIASKLSTYRNKKPNVGIELAALWRLEEAIADDDKEFQDNYETMNIERGRYKSLEASLDIIKSEMVAIVSLMKYNLEGEKYGK